MKFTLDFLGARTVISTAHDVVIEDCYVGPIFRNGNVCLAVFEREGAFEMNCWIGTAGHNEALPKDSIRAFITPTDVGRMSEKEEELVDEVVNEVELPASHLEIGDLELEDIQKAVDMYIIFKGLKKYDD